MAGLTSLEALAKSGPYIHPTTLVHVEHGRLTTVDSGAIHQMATRLLLHMIPLTNKMKQIQTNTILEKGRLKNDLIMQFIFVTGAKS